MKFFDSFIDNSFKLVDGTYFISNTALKILSTRKSYRLLAVENKAPFIPIEALPDEIKRELFIDRTVPCIEERLHKRFQKNQKHDAKIIDDIKWTLDRSLDEQKKFIHNFMSYGFDEHQAQLKSQTLCLMHVIKRFLEKHDTRLVFSAVKEIDTIGEIDCRSFSKFLNYTNWLIRRGIFEGIVLGK